MSDLQRGDLTTEEYREYDFEDFTGHKRVYRIDSPVEVFWRMGGTTHRVVDAAGVVHCLPAPGIEGCVLRWKNRDTSVPVNW